MKIIGIVRKMDELGRIVVPKEIRDTLGINVKDPVEILSDGENIVIRKFNSACIFCGNIQKAMIYKDKFICDNCITVIKEGSLFVADAE